MDLQRFFALHTGPATLPDGEPCELVVQDLGTLKVASGRLAIADTTRLNAPVVVSIPAGEYSVLLTSAKVDETYDLAMKREAYISLVVKDAETHEVGPAPVEPATREWREEPAGGIAGIQNLHGASTQDIGSLTLADADVITHGMPGEPDTWYNGVISIADGTGWFEQMDTDLGGPRGTLNTPFPNAGDAAVDGANAVTVIARSEKLFPLLATRDQAGEITGIHVDLLVTGELAETLEAFDGASAVALEYFKHQELERMRRESSESKKRRGIFGWLTGK